MISIIAWRAPSEGPIGFSLASMWMPRLGSLKWGRAAIARRDSVRMGMVASADAPAAKRKNERRERPLQATGSMGDCIGENPPKAGGLPGESCIAADRCDLTVKMHAH